MKMFSKLPRVRGTAELIADVEVEVEVPVIVSPD